MSAAPRTLVESIRIGSGAEVPGASAGQPMCAIAPTRCGRSIASQSVHSDPSELEMNAGRSSPSPSRTLSIKPTACARSPGGSPGGGSVSR
jgi:hypothetical protein